MESPEEIKRAINSFSEYTPSQCLILNLFIDIAVENKVHATVKYISDELNIKTSTIYFALNFLEAHANVCRLCIAHLLKEIS